MNPLVLPLTALLTLVVPPPSSAQLVVLATHELPTSSQREYLEKPVSTWQEQAEKNGYVVATTAEGFIFVWHENLFNLKRVDEMIAAVSDLVPLARSGEQWFSFGALPEGTRNGLRRLMAGSSIGHEAGPLIEAGDFTFSVRPSARVRLSDGERDVWVPMLMMNSMPPEGFYRTQPSEEELEKFRQERQFELAPRPYPNALMFSFSDARLQWHLRVEATEKFSARIRTLLEAQSRAYARVQEDIVAALLEHASVPSAGQRLNSVGSLVETMRSAGPHVSGFRDEAEMEAFIGRAVLAEVRTSAVIGIGRIAPDGTRITGSVPLTFGRNPGS